MRAFDSFKRHVPMALTGFLFCLALLACAEGIDPPSATRTIRIAGGSFEMGHADVDPCGRFTIGSQIILSPDTNLASEQTVHSVSVTDFCLDEHEVTVNQYRHCVARGICPQPDLRNVGNTDEDGFIKDYYSNPDRYGRHPVAGVSLEGAQTYCAFRFGRLPREIEWEYAARSRGVRRHIVSDPAILPLIESGCDRDGEYRGGIAMGRCSDSIREVASSSLDRTEQGVFDLAGSLAEWTSDPYDPLAYCALEQPGGGPLDDFFDVVDDTFLIRPNAALLATPSDECAEGLVVDERGRYAGDCVDAFESCATSCVPEAPGTACLGTCFVEFNRCAKPCLVDGVSTACTRVDAQDSGCRPHPWCKSRETVSEARVPRDGILTSRMRGRTTVRGGHFQSKLACDARPTARRYDRSPEPVLGFRCAYNTETPRCSSP